MEQGEAGPGAYPQGIMVTNSKPNDKSQKSDGKLVNFMYSAKLQRHSRVEADYLT
jgi:hypothetical protein